MPLKHKPPSIKLDICGPNKEFFSLLEKGGLDELREVFNNYSNILNKIKNIHGQTALHVASKHGHIDIVKHLTENFNSVININITDSIRKKTPLHVASENGHVDIVKYLLSKGANIYILDLSGNTALQYPVVNTNTAEQKLEEVVKCLIDEILFKRKKIKNAGFSFYKNHSAGATLGNKKIARMLIDNEIIDADSKDKQGNTLLQNAAMNFDDRENLEFIKYLVEDKNVYINALDNDENTALHLNLLHIGNNSDETIKYLIDKGTDLSIKNKDGDSVLYLAAKRENINAIKYLLLKGANIEINNYTVFHVAARRSDLEMFKIFESYCCAFNIDQISKNHYYKDSLLCMMIIGRYQGEDLEEIMGTNENEFENRRMKMCEYLVEKYYKSNIDIKSHERTTLFMAAINDRLNVVKYLIEKGAKLENSPDILIEVSKKGNLVMVKYLVEKGAEEIAEGKGKGVKVDDKVGEHEETALIASASVDNLELVQYLSTNSDINHKEKKNGFSALHHASINGFSGAVEHLIKSGANINQLTDSGEKDSPLHLAVINKNYETVKILIQRGAKTDIKNNEGETPYDLALSIGDSIIINLLKREPSHMPVGRINSSSLETISSLDLDNYPNVDTFDNFIDPERNDADLDLAIDRINSDGRKLNSVSIKKRSNKKKNKTNKLSIKKISNKKKNKTHKSSVKKRSIKNKNKTNKSSIKKKSKKKKSIKKYNISIK